MARGVGLREVGRRPLGEPDLARVVVADALQLLDLLRLERGHGNHLDAVSKLAAGEKRAGEHMGSWMKKKSGETN